MESFWKILRDDSKEENLSRRTIFSQSKHLCAIAGGGGPPDGSDISGLGGAGFWGRFGLWFAPKEGAFPGGVPSGKSIKDCGFGGMPNWGRFWWLLWFVPDLPGGTPNGVWLAFWPDPNEGALPGGLLELRLPGALLVSPYEWAKDWSPFFGGDTWYENSESQTK